jgi:hypothetical protein
MNGGIRLRTRIAALLAATAAIGFGTTAHAGNAGTGNESIAVSPSTVAAGADVTVAGAGWFCAADVDVAIEGRWQHHGELGRDRQRRVRHHADGARAAPATTTWSPSTGSRRPA